MSAADRAEQLPLGPVMRELRFDPGIEMPGDSDDEEALRESRRMTLETSSNLYAQRRSQW